MFIRHLSAVLVAISSIAAVLSYPVLAQQLSTDSSDKKTIVFVCEHGSVKSVIAAAHFDDLAQKNGIPYMAAARGINPDGEIPPYVRAGLIREKLDVNGWQPRAFSRHDAVKGERVVTLGCVLPKSVSPGLTRVQNWNDVPSPKDNFRHASEAIARRVALLVTELASKSNQ